MRIWLATSLLASLIGSCAAREFPIPLLVPEARFSASGAGVWLSVPRLAAGDGMHESAVIRIVPPDTIFAPAIYDFPICTGRHCRFPTSARVDVAVRRIETERAMTLEAGAAELLARAEVARKATERTYGYPMPVLENKLTKHSWPHGDWVSARRTCAGRYCGDSFFHLVAPGLLVATSLTFPPDEGTAAYEERIQDWFADYVRAIEVAPQRANGDGPQ